MNPYVLFFLLFGLGLGTTITFASSHWLLAWMGLEVNTLAIIPLMAQSHNPRAVEATTKYFLTQATAAAMLLFASTTNAWLTGQWMIDQMTHPFPTTLIVLALALKIGLAPFHSWLPEVLQGLDLTTGMILSTWQKLAPFSLLLQLPISPSSQTIPGLIILLGAISLLVGGFGGLNEIQLRKLLAYSSIGHMGWMILVKGFCPQIMLFTLCIYIVMNCAMFMTLSTKKVTTTNFLAIFWPFSPGLSITACFLLLSLAGLPPLTGFMSKWLILQELAKQDLGGLATVAALTALLSLFYYLRLSYAVALTISPNNLTGTAPWRLHSANPSLPLSVFTTMGLMLLPITPSLFSLFMV
uniref:NADH dehydrogenase subunit 2 n=1 Tax=Hypoplectrus unicolor TaxID=146808 RepID=UPI0028D08051|nr:NADH dehydrogenase subunit 2 [Hypoplectrus unicolor]YP_010957460.1 NADH dehydrogenase subunit 2 [Hypoplectrus puella]WMY90774.1 NADH dehydrogenase subunit 2 [Hypoplectrus unicolor]WMY90787.1 NADH dehydrogenase subunit 2 [Hypoplectrus puella]WNH21830.1 NADH dehydrogenase subunit 2 [Hypoplectrus nigricans]